MKKTYTHSSVKASMLKSLIKNIVIKLGAKLVSTLRILLLVGSSIKYLPTKLAISKFIFPRRALEASLSEEEHIKRT